MRSTILLPSFLSLLLASATLAQGQDTPAGSTARGAFGIDFTTQYFFRGLQQENQGIIAQPWFDLGYALVDGDEQLRRLDLTFGLWNSLHDGPTGGTGGIWYESDFHVDLAAGLGERLALATRYTAATSPNAFFDPVRNRGFGTTVEELSFTASYDDRALLQDRVANGLQPHVKVAFELDGQRDNGNDRGIYGEIGVAPAFALGESGAFDLTLAVPLTFGFSLTDYYEDQSGGRDEFFGYFDLGAVLSTPLAFLPTRLGPWQGQAALHWIVLGDNLEERNDGDSSELILSFGMSTRF